MSIMDYNGGTVVAMAGEECVCIATDLVLGEQMAVIATDVKKVHKLTDRLYVGLAGFRSDCQTVLDHLQREKSLYELRENRKLSPKVAATLVSNLLYKHRFGYYFINPLIAGLDPITFKPFIADTDIIGTITNPRDFVAVGNASEYALGVCEGFWRENMGPEELFEATAQSLLAAIDRDGSSGHGALIYTITKDKVNVKTIKARMD
ncbi:Proteasome subunit beta [Aphelenchoides besseyi]|nr:Proteasome subunit beta [Aphelenchoides besseyi]KAI6194342.1 Proteasome subunit beta [Aphelenchoides besseyi]